MSGDDAGATRSDSGSRDVPGDDPEAPGAPGIPEWSASPLSALMRVQELDTTISQLDHRKLTLPDRLALGQVETQLVALNARGSQVRARRDAVVARLADLQGQVDTLQTRRATVTERMYSLRGSATRDLQAMDEEVRHLALRQSELEDEELEVMEEQEPLDAEMSEVDHERTTLEETAGRLRSAVAAEESGIEAELSAVRADRRQAFDHVPPDLAHQYETLRARLGGTGAARLVANRCEGCHLQLPAVEIDRIKRLPRDAVATCEQCGRILVRTAATS